MALNINETLDILKRAGLDPDDRMKASERERRLNERLRNLEQDPFCEDEFPDYRRYGRNDPAEEARRRRNLDLLNIDDL